MPDDDRSNRVRSPAYPSVPLGEAIERARALYEREKRALVPLSVAMGHWGYGESSSAGARMIAALKQFGLLEDMGSGGARKVRLTDLAIRILLDQRQDQRAAAVQEAALRPKLYSDLWTRYEGHMPSDENLKSYLMIERNFNDGSVSSVVSDYRTTIEYAGLLSDAGGDSESVASTSATSVSQPSGAPAQSKQKSSEEASLKFEMSCRQVWTLAPGVMVELRSSKPLTSRHYDILKKYVDLASEAASLASSEDAG